MNIFSEAVVAPDHWYVDLQEPSAGSAVQPSRIVTTDWQSFADSHEIQSLGGQIFNLLGIYSGLNGECVCLAIKVQDCGRGILALSGTLAPLAIAVAKDLWDAAGPTPNAPFAGTVVSRRQPQPI